MPDARVVLVTRTAPGCDETAIRLRREGFKPIVSPALSIDPLPTALPDLADVAGLVFTSANGVRAFAQRSRRRDLPAWCVGPATAAAADSAGFAPVFNADGDAANLSAFIAGNTSSAAGRLVHVANDAAAGNLVKSLQNLGFDVDFSPIYTTRPAKALSSDALAALAGGDLFAVLVHSEKGARALAASLKPHRLEHVFAVAISPRAGAPLEVLAFRAVAIAEHPNEDALMSALRMC